MITEFDGKYAFLSNFFHSPFAYDGIEYPTVEHFFQAMKTLDQEERKKIAAADSPGKAKQMGRHVQLRKDWEEIKEAVMLEGLYLKFTDEQLADWLLETGNEELIEGNFWCDQTWGSCNCPKHKDIPGKNLLGKLLMKVRSEIKEERGLK